jgi:hypothetical protein
VTNAAAVRRLTRSAQRGRHEHTNREKGAIVTIFIVGVVVAVIVVSAYLTLGTRDFLRIRREVNHAAAHGIDLDDRGPRQADGEAAIDAGGETVGFAWRALGGVVASVGLLYAVGHLWWAWYAFPALALGTGVAVCVAFVIDPTKDTPASDGAADMVRAEGADD